MTSAQVTASPRALSTSYRSCLSTAIAAATGVATSEASPMAALNHSGSPQITISSRQSRGYSGMPIPARASHLICWRWVRSARRNRSARDTAQAATSTSSTTNATRESSSHHAGGGPNGRSRSANGARNGSSTTAPSIWVTTAAITIVAGTQRQRGDGTRPSGKCSSSSPNVARIHHASSAVTATSHDHRSGSSVVASHWSQISLATTWATARDSSPSSTPTGAPSRRRDINTDSPVAAGTTTTPTARVSHDVRFGSAARKQTARTRWRAASTAHPTAARRAQGMAAL